MKISLEDRRINEWLALVEREIRLTLARNLARAVRELSELYQRAREHPAQVVSQHLLDWLDQFQTQVVDIAVQVVWSDGAYLSVFRFNIYSFIVNK